MRKVWITYLSLCAIGLLVAVYLAFIHFGAVESVCDLSATVSCDVVNKGPYGKFLGIPVSVIGAVGYLLLGVLGWLLWHDKVPMVRRVDTLGLALIALLFSLYLTYLEVFVIGVICPFCVVSQIVIIGIAVCAWMLVKGEKKS